MRTASLLVFRPYAIVAPAAQQIGSSNRAGVLGGMFTTALNVGSTMLLYDASGQASGSPIWTHDDSQLIGSQLNARFSNGLWVVMTGLVKITFIVAFE